MSNLDIINHTVGASIYIDDWAESHDMLFAQPVYGNAAHLDKIKVEWQHLKDHKSFYTFLSVKDIPGHNNIGHDLSKYEPLFAEGKIEYWGQPVGIILCRSEKDAHILKKQVKITGKSLPVIIDEYQAYENEQFLFNPECFSEGNTEEGFKKCTHIISGKAKCAGQEHLYLEPQGAIAYPKEGGALKIKSSTQGPSAVQRVVAQVLGIPMHKIEVEVNRLGGGFGGKEDQASLFAAMAALAALITNKPVKLVLDRPDDLIMTGKRHGYTFHYKIGMNDENKILAYEADLFQNGGAFADLSYPVLTRSLFHATNSYHIPHVKVTGYSCRTNLAPNTAFRGFGGPQGMFAIEAALYELSKKSGIPKEDIQRSNLFQEKNVTHYGQTLDHCHMVKCWDTLLVKYPITETIASINRHNQSQNRYTQGYSFMPVTFGISFTKTTLNQASSLVHIYQDGSIAVTTGAVEMGQGVNTKIAHIIEKTFSRDLSDIQVHFTNTEKNANTSPTAASSGADLNGHATLLACKNIKDRLSDFIREKYPQVRSDDIEFRKDGIYSQGIPLNYSWHQLIHDAYEERVNLSCHEFYKTPVIFFDSFTNKGHPFAYHTYGISFCQVTIDNWYGTYTIDKIFIVHDCGKSLDETIDRGQIEGALAQGIGWMTLEELGYREDGFPLANALSTYKIPDRQSLSKELSITLLDQDNPVGLLKSKAIGEPPLMYGIGAYFALSHALDQIGRKSAIKIDAPMTPEKVFTAMYL